MQATRAILAVLGPMLALSGVATAQTYTYPDAELMDPQFGTEVWGSGTLDARQDLPGQGVRFWITLGAAADGGKTVIGDDWQVAPAAGLAWDDGVYPLDPSGPHAQAHDNVSIAAWDRIEMIVRYVTGPGEIAIKLFMNTGMTGASGYPSNDWHNNTAWTGPPETLSVGQIVTLELDFDSAQGWGIGDNPFPHTAAGLNLADGTWYSINERDRREVTNMGLEVYDASGLGAEQQIVVDVSLPEPAALWLLAVSAAVLVQRRRGSRA